MASLDFRTERLNFNKFYDNNITHLESTKNTFLSIVSSILADEGFEVHSIVGRVKDKNECIKKFIAKYQNTLEGEQIPYEISKYINDLIGLRIVMLYESDINKVGDVLQKEFTLLEKTDKSKLLEEEDNIFGYKGLHLDVKMSEPRASMREYQSCAGFSFEIQVRTIIQDAWSVLDHKIKYKKAIPKYLERRINSLAALFEIADREFLNIQIASKNEEINANSSLNSHENINSFTFYRLLKETMPDLVIAENRLDECVDYILSYGDLSYDECKAYICKSLELVQQFFASLWEKIGESHDIDAFAYMPYILYSANPQKYKDLLPGFTSKGFNDWCAKNSHQLVNQDIPDCLSD